MEWQWWLLIPLAIVGGVAVVVWFVAALYEELTGRGS